ncbi:hypothetical protein WICMUC_001128 [Wickerhamomyces mucosus]|uniref:RBR-type E3 ubiquitin transferase n=1 Tax=Wickerhamomyces mucosus TaxID=1378264 RepID=A0A9P8PY04_9ASCO|nr:hypothetical protein WICMUC_001128 [Wickerhamomyces mucosus]
MKGLLKSTFTKKKKKQDNKYFDASDRMDMLTMTEDGGWKDLGHGGHNESSKITSLEPQIENQNEESKIDKDEELDVEGGSDFEFESDVEFGDEEIDDELFEEEYRNVSDNSEQVFVQQESPILKVDDGTKVKTSLLFKSHTTKDLVKQMSQQCRNLGDILQLDEGDVINLLQYYSWNSDRLIEAYVDNPQAVKKKVGLASSTKVCQHKNKKTYKNNSFECFLCCENRKYTYSLSCKHEYCIDCYKRYIDDRLNTGKVITCPECDLSLTTQDIDAISGEGESIKLLESSIKEYVERHIMYKWCPSPDCGIIVEVSNLADIPHLLEKNEIPIVLCDHGHQFCASCLYENHSPATCAVAKKWVDKCKDDSETIKWILTNTQQCPKCRTSIEKNGGCNHMTCKKCRQEFCWICLGEWYRHGTSFYNCSRYEEKDKNVKQVGKKKKIDADETRESLKRYLHYYNLFSVHEVSTKLDAKRCAQVEEHVRLLQETSGISWIEAQFLVESANTLLNARRVLKWSYALIYYCNITRYLDIYESIQDDLATAVEGLSKLFEIEDPEEIVRAKLDFLNKSRFLADRQNAMLSCTKDLIETGTLPTKL